jgi:predicted Fe-Mo cluster-binding NifX family protein
MREETVSIFLTLKNMSVPPIGMHEEFCMNICIPVEKNDGLDSQLCLHFGKAPMFVVINTDTLHMEVYENIASDSEPDSSACCKLAAEGEINSVVVGGIGLEALSDLQATGLSVYSSTKDTVREIVDEFSSGALNPITMGNRCRSGSRGFGGRGRGFGGVGCGGGAGCGC